MPAPLHGYEDFVSELSTLISAYPPPFIYVHDPVAVRTTASVVHSTISDICQHPEATDNIDVHYAKVDAPSCITQRLLFDTILTALANWEINWESGCATVDSDAPSGRWNDNWDGFLHGLRHLHARHREQSKIDVRFVITIENAQRLKERLPESIVPFTRLDELSQLDITVIFLSHTQWQDIRPPLGASPDPYYIDVKPLSKTDIVKNLSSRFLTISQEAQAANSKYADCYDSSLSQLYTHFITMICDVCFPFVHDVDELAYIAAARWPGFVKPVLEEQEKQKEDIVEQEDPPFTIAPSEDVRLRLIRLFTPTVTNALEELHPRLTNAADWADANDPESDILHRSMGFGSLSSPSKLTTVTTLNRSQQNMSGLTSFPRMSKFILIAAYIASINPAKTDLRMFGRGLDEKKRRRRVVRTGGSKSKGPVKVPQHLLGPNPFPLDRLIAILGALLEENDVDTRLPAPDLSIPGEYTDMEIGRVGIYSAVMELTSKHLLIRASQPERIDGSPMFKCGILYDVALALAKQLDVSLNDLLWDPA